MEKLLIVNKVKLPLRIARNIINRRIAIGYCMLDQLSPESLGEGQKEYNDWDKFNLALLRKMFIHGAKAAEYACAAGPATICGCWQAPLEVKKTAKLRGWIKEKINCLESIQRRLLLAADSDSVNASLSSRQLAEQRSVRRSNG